MKIIVLREADPAETRVALTPESVKKLVGKNAVVAVESGAGDRSNARDSDYAAAGAAVSADRAALAESADLLVAVNRPPDEYFSRLKPGAMVMGLLRPFDEPAQFQPLVERGASAISMELIPRSTLAQKMDALSSQANLAGYVAVITAAARQMRILPMMTTPAGTISPARIFVIGAGVAGLQAIATSKRLGARVDAFDVRPEVEEQIKSLGAKFLKVDLGETGSTAQGYAKQLTEEQLQKQRDAMARQCALSDVVITTAQIFGRKAPVIITADMVKGMKPGSIVIDLAVESGGNVEGSEIDEEIVVDGVRIIGIGNGARQVPVHASQMYSSNIVNFIEHFWNKDTMQLDLDSDDDILNGCLFIHNREVRNETVRNLMR